MLVLAHVRLLRQTVKYKVRLLVEFYAFARLAEELVHGRLAAELDGVNVKQPIGVHVDLVQIVLIAAHCVRIVQVLRLIQAELVHVVQLSHQLAHFLRRFELIGHQLVSRVAQHGFQQLQTLQVDHQLFAAFKGQVGYYELIERFRSIE